MCYDVKAKLESQLKRAKRKNDFAWIAELEEKLKPYGDNPIFHASAFEHPSLLVYTQQQPNAPILAQWGLVPDWVKDEQQKQELWNKTVIARAESIFEKSSFKDSALHSRCLVQIDGFFEHEYRNNKAYPHFVYRKDLQPMSIAALRAEWINPDTNTTENTFAILTTKANGLMTRIHNNPKLPEARTPLILSESEEDEWLNSSQTEFENLLISTHENELQSHTVAPLKGKNSKGNTAEVTDEFLYDAFNTLF